MLAVCWFGFGLYGLGVSGFKYSCGFGVFGVIWIWLLGFVCYRFYVSSGCFCLVGLLLW